MGSRNLYNPNFVPSESDDEDMQEQQPATIDRFARRARSPAGPVRFDHVRGPLPVDTASEASDSASISAFNEPDDGFATYDGPETLDSDTDADSGADDAVGIVNRALRMVSVVDADVEMTDLSDAKVSARGRISDIETDFTARSAESVEPEDLLDDLPFLDDDDDDDDEDGPPISIPNRNYRNDQANADDPTAEVGRESAPFQMTAFLLAMISYCEKWKLSREQWSDLRAVLQLITPLPQELETLPTRVDTLKGALDRQTPLLRQRERELQLNPSMIPTRTSLTDKIRLFDMTDVFHRMAHSDRITKNGHFGLADIVDEPAEFWESESWGCSNRTTSGEFAMIKGSVNPDEPILASEFVWYYNASNQLTLGRVMFVGRDRTAAAQSQGRFGKVTLIIGNVYLSGALPADMQDQVASVRPSIDAPQQELFLVEGEPPVKVLETDLSHRESRIFLDYNFGTKTRHRHPSWPKYIIRHIFTLSPPRIRRLALSSPHRGELEINEYTREKILDRLTTRDDRIVISFPYTAFIDGFGIYRTMHRSMIGIYLQWAFMDAIDRKRSINMLPLTLSPFGSRWEDVVRSLIHLADLEIGVSVTLDNGSQAVIVAPCLAYVGDMPQQQANSGCKSQNAEHFCRFCLVGSDEKANLHYDIVANGRYHYEMLRCRQQAERKSARERDEIFHDLGISKEEPWLRILTPALDLLRSRPPDAAHSEFKGIARQLVTCLFEDILKASFHEDFAKQFATLPVPPGWPRNSHIKRHFGSYSMQEFGRAIIMIPIVLRKWLLTIHLRKRYVEAIDAVLFERNETSEHEGINFLVHCFATVAKSIALFIGPVLRKADREWVQSVAIESRERYQDILKFAAYAASKKTSRNDLASQSQMLERRMSVSSNASSTTGDLRPQPMFGEEEEEEFAAPTAKAKARGEIRRQALERRCETPNVHSALHFYDVVIQYASALNVLTLQGEDRHRSFKKWVQNTNHRQLSKSLLEIECRRQTTVLILDGAYKSTHKKMTATYKYVADKCPTLFRHLTAIGTEAEVDDEAKLDKQRLKGDAEHLDPEAQSRVSPNSPAIRDDPWLSVQFNHQLGNLHNFNEHLRNAYEREYRLSVITMEHWPLSWVRRLKFTSSFTRKPVIFKIGDYIKLTNNTIGRVDGIFTHKVDRARRLFVVLSLADGTFEDEGLIHAFRETEGNQDPILKCRFVEMSGKRTIAGLPAITPQRLWIVPSRETGLLWNIAEEIWFM